MYKTVRQGENSLQYHILPQDDVSSGHVMKRRRSTRHRTAFILVITVILGCAIVAAAVLIPVLMTSNVVTLPARFQTFAVAASSVNMKGHGKYTLQGTQYIALLPVKDPLGHFNAYQLRPSVFTSTSTTTTTQKPTTSTTTSTVIPTTTDVFRISPPQEMSSLLGVRMENNDPHRPQNLEPMMKNKIPNMEQWGVQDHYAFPLGELKGGVLVVVVALVVLILTVTLGLCLCFRRCTHNAKREDERLRGTLLAEVSVDED